MVNSVDRASADIDATLAGLGVLAGLVAVRTFLSWTLALEIDGRWPWQAQQPIRGGSKS